MFTFYYLCIQILQLRRVIATLALLGFALPSIALTIGRPQGATWIGKPLDVVIPLSLDANEAGGSLCLEADVLQGESRFDSGRLTVSLEPGANPANSRMRIRSSQVVEEPVVTITARAGCDMRSSRSYVLLADLPPAQPALVDRRLENAAAPDRTNRGAAVPARAPTRSAGESGVQGGPTGRRERAPSTGAGSRGGATAAPGAPRRAVQASSAPRRTAQAAAGPAGLAAASRRATPPPVPVSRSEAVAAPGPRLQMEPLEPVVESGLKNSPSLTPPVSDDPAVRAAAAAQWRALGTPPEEAQREAQRTQAMEATLATLREQTAQNQQTLLALHSELAEARQSRYSNPLVYALVLLLLIALVGMLLMWRTARRAAPPAWWRDGNSVLPPSQNGDLLDDDLTRPAATGPRSAASVAFGASPYADDDDEDGAYSGYGDIHGASAADGAPARSVNTEELFDVQQQSDFFLSLGQHDQAIAVLREHIADTPGTSALAYLDLLQIFHSLDRKDEYARLAQEFELAFNADVPAFDQFTQEGRGLEYYRGPLARITSQWPAASTLALIEELVFRRPGAHEDEAFDLSAYRELLLLYSVAKEVIDPDSAPPAPVTPLSFVDTFSHETPGAELTSLNTQPAVLEGAPTLPPSLYGQIDDGLARETVLVAAPARVAPQDVEAPLPAIGIDVDLSTFDRTAYETLPATIEPPAAPGPDPHVIDFDLFDPETEAEIAPRPIRKR